MDGFPPIPDYIGLNAPIGEEYALSHLPVTGTLPADVEGTFFRAVPDPGFPPFIEDSAASLSGDGMVSAIRFKDGKVSTQMRYVQTARRCAEVHSSRALFGKYRNPFTDQPGTEGIDRTVANTTPIWHAGKLLLAKEDGRPYRVDPHTLETLGSYDFGGKLTSQTSTAHARVDPVTGELFMFGYEADGLASTTIAYWIVDRDGALTTEVKFQAPYCAMMHDFTITENYALFPVYPTTCDLERLKAGGDHWHHEQGRESWLGVMPRYGDPSELRWFRGPKGVFCFHMMNAWEDGAGRIHFDQCLSDTNPFPFVRAASGIARPQWEVKSALTRWSVDFAGESDEIATQEIGPPGDFPIIPATSQGRPYVKAWMLTMNPEMRGPPVFGGPAGSMFNMLLQLDMSGGPQGPVAGALALDPGMCFHEPVHVPSKAEGHAGWLVAVVDRQLGPDAFAHQCWVIDAGNVGAGPVAKVDIPKRLRPQIHGWWVGAAALVAV